MFIFTVYKHKQVFATYNKSLCNQSIPCFCTLMHCERFRDRKNGNNRINIGDDWYWPRIKRVKLNLSPWRFSRLKLNFAYWLIDRNYLIHIIWCPCDSSPILFLSYEGVTYYGNGYSVGRFAWYGEIPLALILGLLWTRLYKKCKGCYHAESEIVWVAICPTLKKCHGCF